MTRNEFEEVARNEGYHELIEASFKPLSKREIHSHDKVSFVYVLEGEFILNTVDGSPSYRSGETCVVEKGIDHAEGAGPEGASILVARK